VPSNRKKSDGSSELIYPIVKLDSEDSELQRKTARDAPKGEAREREAVARQGEPETSEKGSKYKYKSSQAAPVRVPRDKRSIWPLFFYFTFSLVTVVVSFLVASASTFGGSSFLFTWSVFGIFLTGVVAMIALALRIYIKLNNSKFEIRSKCVRHMAGRYSLQQEVIEINYRDIGWVRVSQSILERLMDIGTIEIGAAHSHLPEISIDGRANPHKYANMIHRRLAKHKKIEVSLTDGAETVH